MWDVVVLFCPALRVLERDLRAATHMIRWNGGLWVSWPKLRSPLASDLRESDVRSAGLAAGLVDNKICAVDDDWSGLRLVFRREDRPAGTR